jgi:hypothetical protein
MSRSCLGRETAKHYRPVECIGAKKTRIGGNPDPGHISTSCAERSKLSMRTFVQRFTRLVLGFSKKIENHCHMVAVHMVWYNLAKIPQDTQADASDGRGRERQGLVRR